jgi:GNAT superfamily N-acetyltransferase
VKLMERIEIRLANTSERKSLEELQWRASLNNEGDRSALLAHPDAIELPLSQIENDLVFVAEEEDCIKGFAAIVLRTDGNVELDALFVEPEHWKQGIGRALVEHCSSVANTKGANCLHVTGNTHAEGFYISCNFKAIGTIDTRFGVGLLMERDL